MRRAARGPRASPDPARVLARAALQLLSLLPLPVTSWGDTTLSSAADSGWAPRMAAPVAAPNGHSGQRAPLASSRQGAAGAQAQRGARPVSSRLGCSS
jgi:hypothetical protein